ncbi:MAG: tRNA isopentenyl-2-thiomethyl-A-37 hydroxylase MiaE, partial [Gammaproteobacteria bacterium]|nr:tRNA isopentenyl-2-thiomethyl-A-37 hydroxylase MiaE [Gammaproteobacteria bacterium]
ALADLDLLLLDHATLELKAAQQAQKLIWKYCAAGGQRERFGDRFVGRLAAKMSRLAREELRHFEQVVALIERRGGRYRAVPPSRYAAGLHAHARSGEPDALIDALVIGAIIEARSCERFYTLAGPLESKEPALAKFYASLLRSEARHFEDYLALARDLDGDGAAARTDELLACDADLIASPDTALRFHSGIVERAMPC